MVVIVLIISDLSLLSSVIIGEHFTDIKGSNYMLVHSLASKCKICHPRETNVLDPPQSDHWTPLLKSDDLFLGNQEILDPTFKNPHSEMYKRMLPFNGPKVWNSVPHEMRNSSSLDQFKKSYKQYFLDLFS